MKVRPLLSHSEIQFELLKLHQRWPKPQNWFIPFLRLFSVRATTTFYRQVSPDRPLEAFERPVREGHRFR